MDTIHLLDKATIDKIAAGEVVDRPSSVVKELCENAIDAGASAISVEIEGGGCSMIRITDNGRGIDAGQVKKAFLRHTTSKINDADDLHFVKTLGFRGEALSSISAVSRLELYTKTKDSLTGIIYKIHGGKEAGFEEAGLPDGTTLIVRDLFYNTPARLKFLKTEKTEAGYVTDIVEKIALSHPEISIKFTNNHSLKLSTTGNGSLKDAIYAVYGKEIAGKLIEVNGENSFLTLKGYIGQPQIARGNRNFENYFINGRYIRDKVIEAAIEEAYKGWQMKGTFPFTAFDVQIEPELIDVNVHPSKMEIRFFDNRLVFEAISSMLSEKIKEHEMIPSAVVADKQTGAKEIASKQSVPEPFETKRTLEFIKKYAEPVQKAPAFVKEENRYYARKPNAGQTPIESAHDKPANDSSLEKPSSPVQPVIAEPVQETLFNDRFLSEKARLSHRLAGQVFDTYWIVEYGDSLFLIDQHAAHEKVKYEEFMKALKEGTHYSQNLMPPLLLTLDHTQEAALLKYMEQFQTLGFVIDHFGGADYSVSALPMDLYGLNNKTQFLLMLDELAGIRGSFSPEVLLDKVATASCKAAVKGGNRLSFAEADALIDKLLDLDNPYNCPHGRPTIITITKTELERKFKRLL